MVGLPRELPKAKPASLAKVPKVLSNLQVVELYIRSIRSLQKMQHFSILSRTPLFYENVWKMIENNAFTSVMLSSISSTVERNAISLFAFQDTPAGTLQRKKSLPDVQCLDVTTKAQGSKAMTREEISVLSSARREAVRKQLEEIEAYKSNPFLYILNPRVKVSSILFIISESADSSADSHIMKGGQVI